MSDLVDKLLQPIPGDDPCGPDLSNDPSYDELTNLAKGKPEVEIGSVQKPAEPPDWRELRDKSAEFLGRSKHLNVAVMYGCSRMQTDGLAGFCDGLKLIRGLIEQQWEKLHPRLDPEDNNDPTQRLNILGALTASRGAVGGWLKPMDYLYSAEVCRRPGMPPITFDQLMAARDKLPGAPDASALGSALNEAGADVIQKIQKSLEEALEDATGLDQFLTTTLGAGNTISFDTLQKGLAELISLIAPYASGGAVATDGTTPAEDGAPAHADQGGATFSIRGDIKSREDVVRVIDTICAYYDQVEPSSPVPYVLRRAQKMVKMNFVEMVHELGLGTSESLRPSMGSAIDAAAPADSGTPSES